MDIAKLADLDASLLKREGEATPSLLEPTRPWWFWNENSRAKGKPSSPATRTAASAARVGVSPRSAVRERRGSR